MAPPEDIPTTRRLLYVCVAIIIVAALLIMATPAQASTRLGDNAELTGGTYGTVYADGLGIVIRDATIGNLIVRRGVDMSLFDTTVGRAYINGQNLSIERMTVARSLTLYGEVQFIDYLEMSGPLVINASHVRIHGINMRLPERSGLSLIRGWGHDVQVTQFMGWGGRSLLGRVGMDWLVTNGGYHGPRLTLWPSYVFPYAYPIGDGVLLYEMR